MASDPDPNIFVLGFHLGNHPDHGLAAAARQLLWFSYRRLFEPIEPTSYTSDAGWGCTLRAGQMVMATAILTHLQDYGMLHQPKSDSYL